MLRKLSNKPVRVLFAVFMIMMIAGCSAYHSEEKKDEKFQTLQQGMAPQVTNKYDGKTAVYSVTIADQAAERVVMLDEVDQAYVLLYDGNAYVAVRLHNHRNTIPPHIQEKVVNQVIEAAPMEGQVYVTTNLKFVDWIQAYVHGANLGRTDQDLEEQLERLLNHSFQGQHETKMSDREGERR